MGAISIMDGERIHERLEGIEEKLSEISDMLAGGRNGRLPVQIKHIGLTFNIVLCAILFVLYKLAVWMFAM